MKILVTGRAGFIGSHVVDALLEAGHDVAIVDNLSTGKCQNISPAARFYEVDIRSPELARVFAEEQPEIVNHHAARMDVRRSVADPIYDADVNPPGSLNLLELCGYDLAPPHGPAKLGETVGKARRDVSWVAQVTLREGLERTVDYFRVAVKA